MLPIKLLVTLKIKLLPRAVLLHIRLLVTSKLLPRAVLLPSGQQPYSLAAHPQPSKLGPLKKIYMYKELNNQNIWYNTNIETIF